MNNLSLYQLSHNYLQALDFLTDPELDLPVEAINDTLEALEGELEDKAINVAKFLRNMEATAEAIKAAEAVDECVGKVLDKVKQLGGAAIVTADHGNFELMYDATTDQPHTAHTVGDVPLIIFGSFIFLSHSTPKRGVVILGVIVPRNP